MAATQQSEVTSTTVDSGSTRSPRTLPPTSQKHHHHQSHNPTMSIQGTAQRPPLNGSKPRRSRYQATRRRRVQALYNNTMPNKVGQLYTVQHYVQKNSPSAGGLQCPNPRCEREENVHTQPKTTPGDVAEVDQRLLPCAPSGQTILKQNRTAGQATPTASRERELNP